MSSNNTTTTTSPPKSAEYWYQYAGFGCLTLATNCLVMFVLCLNPKLFKKSAFIFGLTLGDFTNGLALTVNGALRAARTLDGTVTFPYRPSLCMTTFLTPTFLLGNQIPGFVFFLIGLERLAAVVFYDWYYAKWSNKLAWLATALMFACSAVSLSAAFAVVLSIEDGSSTTLACATSTVVGAGYSVYNYGVSIVGGSVAAGATVWAMISFTKRKRAARQQQSLSVKNHIKRQWQTTRIMLCLALLDLGLVVAPNVLVTLASGFKVAALSNVQQWSLQVICLRSMLNIFIYLAVNREFRACFVASFGCSKKAVFDIDATTVPKEDMAMHRVAF